MTKTLIEKKVDFIPKNLLTVRPIYLEAFANIMKITNVKILSYNYEKGVVSI